MRLLRRLRERGREAEALVEELRESRAAQAEAAALAERGRVARDMHDVLAHSLSALALQLEGAAAARAATAAPTPRSSARDRARAPPRPRPASTRRGAAIGALRGDELPGPERLPALADGFADRRAAADRRPASRATLALRGAAGAVPHRPGGADERPQPRAADRVELRARATPTTARARRRRTTAAARRAGEPAAAAATASTGMRERAELLGGRLTAGPTGDGFRVELWLPA